jgi:hypothetical protein
MRLNKHIAAAGLLTISIGAQAATIQGGYMGQIDGTASGNDLGLVLIGDQKVNVGDSLTGMFSFDSLLPIQAPSLVVPFPSPTSDKVTVYKNANTSSILNIVGTPNLPSFPYASSGGVLLPVVPAPASTPPAVNALSTELNGFSVVNAPTLTCPAACENITVTRTRFGTPGPYGAVESLNIKYLSGVTLAPIDLNNQLLLVNPGLVFTPQPVSPSGVVTSVSIDLFYDQALAGTELPDLSALSNFKVGRATLNLSNGAGVFATLQKISPVPEPSAWTLMGLGLVGLGAMTRRKNRVA